MIYELYGFAHKIVKKLLHRNISDSAYRMICISSEYVDEFSYIQLPVRSVDDYINDLSPIPNQIRQKEVYPTENIVAAASFPSFKDSFSVIQKCDENKLGIDKKDAIQAWLDFVDSSVIPEGFRNEGLHYAGYIWDCEEWCLPSWIWTNAALVRMYCSLNEIAKAGNIADKLIDQQLECGGWIVRNDYDREGAAPILAPNDSAFIANNGCLEYYLCSKDKKYLLSAIKCAEWIINTARDDGMVYVGYNTKRKQWQLKHNIVDVGFTAGLFARLYKITGEDKYLIFLNKFTQRFIELFYIPPKHGFATSLDEHDHQHGGMFGRGQAWALEGLIPAYRVLMDDNLYNVIDSTIDNLLHVQDKSGGWSYNLSKPLMGIDCKATAIIACSIMDWFEDNPTNFKLKAAAEKALNWCVSHTMCDGKARGGIFSYTIEGAIVHHMYTRTAFVYGSSYAIYLHRILNGE